MTACDFSFVRYTATSLKAAGVTAVGRYLGVGSGKTITGVELAGLLYGGLEVWLVFENGATDASGGAAVGAAYAQQANQALITLGLPLSTPVYFAADQDYPNPAQAVPYFQGVASIRPLETNGCYGEGALIDLLFQEHLIGYGWESESTSFPGNAAASPNAAIWQKANQAPLAGTDLDLIRMPDFGQLPRPTSQGVTTEMPAPNDVVDSWSVPGSGGSAYFNLLASGALDAYGGAVPSQIEYVAVANDGARYHFGPNVTPGVFTYLGLPAADRQGDRYFVGMSVLAYEGKTIGGAAGPEGPAGPVGPAGPPGPVGATGNVNAALKTALEAAVNAVP